MRKLMHDIVVDLYARKVFPESTAERYLERLNQQPRWIPLRADVELPLRATEGSMGYDLLAQEDTYIKAGAWVTVATGLTVEMPEGMSCDIRPRSGLARKQGITVLNSPGLIDSDYTPCEIGVVLINHGKGTFYVRKGMAIAQATFVRHELAVNDRCQEITRTDGFGHTTKEETPC